MVRKPAYELNAVPSSALRSLIAIETPKFSLVVRDGRGKQQTRLWHPKYKTAPLCTTHRKNDAYYFWNEKGSTAKHLNYVDKHQDEHAALSV